MQIFPLFQYKSRPDPKFVKKITARIQPKSNKIHHSLDRVQCSSLPCILLRSEILSGMCAKLRTVAASNNRDHARNLSYYCLLALHILWCYSSRTTHSWWITHNQRNTTREVATIPTRVLHGLKFFVRTHTAPQNLNPPRTCMSLKNFARTCPADHLNPRSPPHFFSLRFAPVRILLKTHN